ncbi:MAG: hypothetical protein R2832_11815 [Rhodothermales bacterium]
MKPLHRPEHMKNIILPVVALLLCGSAIAQDNQDLIAAAVEAAPVQLRENATVVQIGADGTRTVLRQGSNGLTCRTDMLPTPPYLVRCHPSSMESLFDRMDTLIQVDGLWGDKLLEASLKSMRDDNLPTPSAGTTTYLFVGPDREAASRLTAVMIPMTSGADLGLGEAEEPDRPWLMWGGTALGHIMISGM